MAAEARTGGARAIFAASVGNVLEWYDFSVYALFAIAIGANFFPGGNPAVGLLKAFLFFAAGFVIRPVGALVMGSYGDRAGRKAALTVTILIMASGTLIIAVAPTYAAIGLGAPLILLLARLLQGFSAGGEIGSAAAFLVEHAPPRRRALFAAWLQGSMGISNILGALVGFTVNASLPAAEVVRWGWRLPFLLGLVIVPLGVYLRRTLKETPAFRKEIEHTNSRPVTRVFRDHRRELLAGFGISVLWAATVYVLLIYMPVYLQKALGFTATQAFGGSLVENVIFVAGCFGFGALADRIGHTRVQALSALGLLLAVLPLFVWMSRAHSTAVLFTALAALGALAASFTSVAPTMLSEIFPTQVRVTGLSLVYNAAFTVFGGFAPAILSTSFAARTGLAPAWYVTVAAIPALLATRISIRSVQVH